MNKQAVFFILLCMLASLSTGSVRKTEDPIRDTQTNPILYEQKKEEDKDGKKGPLMYHVKNNPRERFFIDPPIDKEKKDTGAGEAAVKTPVAEDTSGWWEEQPTDLPQTPAPEAEQAYQPEPVPQEETSGVVPEPEPPVPQAEEKDTAAEQKDDYWW